MNNAFKSKFMVLFFGVVLCFLVLPSVYGIDNDSQLDCDVNVKCDDQHSQDDVKKAEELEKILLEWADYSEQHPEDIDKQYELYKKALDLAEKMEIMI